MNAKCGCMEVYRLSACAAGEDQYFVALRRCNDDSMFEAEERVTKKTALREVELRLSPIGWSS